MEREPEEDGDAEHCKEGGHTLLDLLSHALFLFCRILYGLHFLFLCGSGKAFLCAEENHE